MDSLCAIVILGGKKPCVVELASKIAEALVSEDAPTITFPFTVALFKMPTLVKLEPVTEAFKLVPVKVPALAATVILLVPSKATPLIFLALVSFVAVDAEAALPFILPLMVLVTVKLAKVPTDVKLELITDDFKVVPVSVPASLVIVISLVPSNAVPLIFLALVNLFAVDAEAALPFTLPFIVLVTVKFVNVPTEVKLELITVDFSVLPVKVPASAAIVISLVPSNATPFIFLEIESLVEVAALPVVD
jgi:hypothetical protein